MASYRMLPDTVTLYNYIGEVNMEAQYAVSILRYVFCNTELGVRATNQGNMPDDSAVLYVFDSKVHAESPAGAPKQYLSYDQWLQCENKEDYFTFGEKDYFIQGISESGTPQNAHDAYQVRKVSRYQNGTARMWHWEINGI